MNLPKTLSGRRLLILTFVGLTVAVAFFLYPTPKNPVQSSSLPLTTNTTAFDKQEKISPGLPLRLKIPAINVDAALEYLGMTPQGEMGVPKNPANAGWFNLGPRPGDNGNSVINGHFGYKDNIPAVFDNLNKLRKGDKLYITDEKGTITTFVVRESRSYDPKADASGVFRSSDGKAHLNLITCEGVWSSAQKSYSNRLVVFADKEIQ